LRNTQIGVEGRSYDVRGSFGLKEKGEKGEERRKAARRKEERAGERKLGSGTSKIGGSPAEQVRGVGASKEGGKKKKRVKNTVPLATKGCRGEKKEAREARGGK